MSSSSTSRDMEEGKVDELEEKQQQVEAGHSRANEEGEEETSSFLLSPSKKSSTHPEEASNEEDHGLQKEDERYEILDKAIESLGFGPFQIKVLVLTSFGVFVDALEANLISILYPVFLTTKFATSFNDLAMVSSLQATGMLLGSILFGIASDRFGRRFIYLTTLSIVVLFGLISSFAPDIVSFAVLRLFLGLGYGGNNNAGTSLMLELMPSEKRGSASATHGLNWGLGSVLIASIAWIGGDALDWRWLVRIPSFIAIPVLIAVFLWIPESPRYYVHMDDNAKLLQSVETISKANGVTSSTMMTIEMLNEARERSKDMKKNKLEHSSNVFYKTCTSMTRIFTSRHITILLTVLGLVWLLNGVGLTLITWLPLHAGLVNKPLPAPADTVYVTAFVSAWGVIAAAICAILVGARFRRQLLIRLGLLGAASFSFGIGFISQDLAAFYACAFFLCFFGQLVTGALFLYTPEILPTNIRSSGFGICLALFRVGSVFAPFVAATILINFQSFAIAGCVFGAVLISAFVASIFTNVDTLNVPLKERGITESRLTLA